MQSPARSTNTSLAVAKPRSKFFLVMLVNTHLSSFFEGSCTINEEGERLYLYAGSDDNFLYKLSSDGELIWEYDTESYPSGVI